MGAISPLGLSLSAVLAREAASGGKKQINVIFMFLQGDVHIMCGSPEDKNQCPGQRR